MKNALFTSGIIAIILLTLHLTGVADADGAVNKALDQGNAQFDLTEYQEALDVYEKCLITTPDDKALNFNSAQAAYMLGEYEKAMLYYDKSEDCIDKFINAGNAAFKLGDTEQDTNQKLQYYNTALQFYLDGIKKYPQDLPIKYNYEVLLEKIEELSEQIKEEQENQEQESQEQESQEQESQEQESQEQESQEQESQEQESQEQDGESLQEDQEQESDENETATQDQNEDQEGEQQESYNQNNEEAQDPDQEAIERILKMLESQEEESLKNNQSVISGKEGKYDW